MCGDDWRKPQPRDHENTGKYGRGKIARKYEMGSLLTASIILTTNRG